MPTTVKAAPGLVAASAKSNSRAQSKSPPLGQSVTRSRFANRYSMPSPAISKNAEAKESHLGWRLFREEIGTLFIWTQKAAGVEISRPVVTGIVPTSAFVINLLYHGVDRIHQSLLRRVFGIKSLADQGICSSLKTIARAKEIIPMIGFPQFRKQARSSSATKVQTSLNSQMISQR